MDLSITQVRGDFMFSIRFRRVRRRNDFCISSRNRLCLTLDIWNKENIGLGKYVLDDIWWP